MTVRPDNDDTERDTVNQELKLSTMHLILSWLGWSKLIGFVVQRT